MYSRTRVYFQAKLKCEVETVKGNGKSDTIISSSSGSTLLNLYGQRLFFQFFIAIFAVIFVVVSIVFFITRKFALCHSIKIVTDWVVASQFIIVYTLFQLHIQIASDKAFEKLFSLLKKKSWLFICRVLENSILPRVTKTIKK